MRTQTLNEVQKITGVGVHSGQTINLSLCPFEGGYLEFVRTDLDNTAFRIDPTKIEAKYSTNLTERGQAIKTIEHLLAALYVFGIDSLRIELDGHEIPILDGSAAPYTRLVREGGIRELPEEKKMIRILKSFAVRADRASLSVEPAADCRISYGIEYGHPAIGKQDIDVTIDTDVFVKEIAPARTFGFLKDVPAMRAQGLALGGSLENAIVLDEDKVINGPLRFPDEFVRHKVLDFLGDLSLFGYAVTGHFKVDKGGHLLHHKLVLFLLDNPEYWSFI